MRPAAVEQVEKPKVKADPYAGDKAIAAASKKLDTLRAADASPAVIARAARRLDDARLDHDERLATVRSAAREQAHATARESLRLEVERETLFRLSGMTPFIGVRFNGMQISIAPERSTDATLRGFCYHDFHAVLAVLQRETLRVAGIARKASGPLLVMPTDQVRLMHEIQDVARRSIAHGLLQVEMIEAS
jgi:hypothetical protein